MSNRALHSEPPYDDALLRFSLWVVLLTAAGLLNLPMSPPEIPPWRVLIIVFSATLYTGIRCGSVPPLCLPAPSNSATIAFSFPEPSPDPTGQRSLEACDLRDGALGGWTLQPPNREGDPVWGGPCDVLDIRSWLGSPLFEPAKTEVPVSTPWTCPRRLMWVELGLATFAMVGDPLE
ncbi:hypothetical protein QJS04_geneDACA023844 [Acorus gramineus]|uniref:Uncharacterized protein n=1 Tax=Acorus gramineus TaxID=55184 RepID=A0AAV9BLZ1_ACOGR|nr:hypothetical protein QJS04_geneDACA023844 [Acorus gramineus]